MSRLSLSVVPNPRSLDEIADSIRSHWSATEEDRFAIGRDLLEARERFPGDTEFGQWMQLQGFAFSRQWAHTLRLAAQHEPAVRAALSTQVDSGKAENLKAAVAAVLHPSRIEVVPEPRAGYPAHYRELRAAFRAVAAFAGDIDALEDAMTARQRELLRVDARAAGRVVRSIDVEILIVEVP